MFLLLACVAMFWEEPCKSGLGVGQKFGPYTFLVSTGEKRGTSHCFVCETGDKPAVIVFAQKASPALGELLVALDGVATKQPKGKELAAWVTFLADDQPSLEPKIAAWGKELGLKSIALGIFEDAEGPPSYRLSKQAEATVLLVKGGKVKANYAFRAGELKSEHAKAIAGAAADLAATP